MHAEPHNEHASAKVNGSIPGIVALQIPPLLSADALSLLCHDLRTPIGQIIGYAEMLVEEAEGASTDFTDQLKAMAAIAEGGLEAISLLRQKPLAEVTAADLQSLRIALKARASHLLSMIKAIQPIAPNSAWADLERISQAAARLGDAGFEVEKSGIGERKKAPPVRVIPAPDEPAPAIRRENAARILIVDDDADNRKLLARRLEKEGHAIEFAENGRQALDKVRAQAFDLVLLDIVMPELDGVAALTELKKDPSLRETPVIMISGLDEVNSVVRCIEIGAEDYLQKPFNPVLLRARVNALLERRRLRAEELRRARELEAAIEEAAGQREKTEALLLNILPKGVAAELQLKGSVEPMYLDDVTIGFTDFVGFTLSTERRSAEDLVQCLHEYFSAFDEITARYNVEKLKTIGDSYMFASSVPEHTRSHPVDAVLAALELVEAVTRMATLSHLPSWQVRVGVHCGPVMAGVVGSRKFAFDVWGDTVNMAARLESNSKPNQVNISRSLYVRVKDFFNCEHRGLIKIKDGWDVDMYFVNGISPQLITDRPGDQSLFARRYEKYFQRKLTAAPLFLFGKRQEI